MIEILSDTSAPIFLIAFAGLSLICILCARLWAQRDDSGQHLLPAPGDLTPIEISVLRGGRNAAICTAIFSLWHQNLLRLNRLGSLIEAVPSSEHKVSPVEQVVYKFARTPRDPSRFFYDAGMLLQIDVNLESVHKKLIQKHLLRTEANQKRVWQAFLGAFLPIAAVGGTRLVTDLMRGQSIFLLLILLVFSVIVLLRVLKARQGRPTQLGWKYLRALRKHFEEMKSTAREDKAAGLPDPVLGIAVFGEGLLEGDPSYKLFSQSFPRGFTKESRRPRIFSLGKELSGNIAEVPRETESGGENI